MKDIYSPGADIGAHKGAHGVKPLGQGCRPGIQVGFCVLYHQIRVLLQNLLKAVPVVTLGVIK